MLDPIKRAEELLEKREGFSKPWVINVDGEGINRTVELGTEDDDRRFLPLIDISEPYEDWTVNLVTYLFSLHNDGPEIIKGLIAEVQRLERVADQAVDLTGMKLTKDGDRIRAATTSLVVGDNKEFPDLAAYLRTKEEEESDGS